MPPTFGGGETPSLLFIAERSMDEGLKEFEAAEADPFSVDRLRQAVIYVCSRKQDLTGGMVDSLSSCLPVAEDEEINLESLVKSQLRSAVSLKDSFFNRNGSIKSDTSSKDAKDALSSCQQIINVVMKQEEQLDRNARLTKMENIFMSCVQGMPEEYKNKFLDQMAKQLGELQ